jgi:hypothetical protein
MNTLKILFWTLVVIGAIAGFLGIAGLMFMTALAVGFPLWFVNTACVIVFAVTAYIIYETW